jgi:hypothetical protein
MFLKIKDFSVVDVKDKKEFLEKYPIDSIILETFEKIPDNLWCYDFIDGSFVFNQSKEDKLLSSEKKALQLHSNKEYREYLKSTDWYITRKIETDIEVPKEVLEKRKEARLKVVD